MVFNLKNFNGTCSHTNKDITNWYTKFELKKKYIDIEHTKLYPLMKTINVLQKKIGQVELDRTYLGDIGK